MIKFSLTELETARRNPAGFARTLIEKSSSKERFSFSIYQAWQNAVLYWHKINDDARALEYLREALTKFRTIARNENAQLERMRKLTSYIRSHRNLKYSFMEGRKIVSIPIYNDVLLTGRIPIINLNSNGGYSIVFFSKGSASWDDQLKLPITQSFFAETAFGCDPSNVEVGIFSYNDERYYLKTYGQKDIRKCMSELSKIGKKIYETTVSNASNRLRV